MSVRTPRVGDGEHGAGDGAAGDALALRAYPSERPGSRLRATAALLALVALMGLAWRTLVLEAAGTVPPLSGEALGRAWDFVRDLAGAGAGEVAFQRGAAWVEALRLAADTLAMSVLAILLAGAGALLTLPLAARRRFDPSHAAERRGRRIAGEAASALVRGGYAVTRGVPELFWAMIIIFVVEPGPVAAVLALGIHNLGVLGRIGSEQVEDLDPEPTAALRAGGAGRAQVLAYGTLPQLLPQFMTFLLYRWEVVIRTTAVVGFVVSAGLGYQLRLELSYLHYTDVALIIVVYVLVVWAVDLASAGLRRLAR